MGYIEQKLYVNGSVVGTKNGLDSDGILAGMNSIILCSSTLMPLTLYYSASKMESKVLICAPFVSGYGMILGITCCPTSACRESGR